MSRMLAEVPSELDFLTSMGVEPHESSPSDGFWSYRFEDESGINLILSFDQHAGSIQTSLFLGDRRLSTVSHEGLESLRILNGQDGQLVGICKSRGESTEMVLTVFPKLLVRWASLRIE